MKPALVSAFVWLFAGTLFAQSPSSATQRLDTLQASFAASLKKRVSDAHEAAVARLNTSYNSALDRALAAATQAGKLEEALVIRDEKTRLAASGPMPADAGGDPAPLKSLRDTYRAAIAKLEDTRDQTAAPLKAAYDKALASLQSDLTKAGDLDAALAVKAVRDGLARNSSLPTDPKVATRSDEQVMNQTKPAKYDPGAAMKIIEWLFTCKGIAVVSTDGGKTLVEARSRAELPKGKFELIKTAHGLSSQGVPDAPFPWSSLRGVPTLSRLGLKQKQPITADDLENLVALPALQSLALPRAQISAAAFDALPVNPKMSVLALYGSEVSSLEVFDRLAIKYPNLRELDARDRFPINPEMVNVCARLKNLSTLSTTGVLTKDVLAAMASLPNLKSWNHAGRVDENTAPGAFHAPLRNLTHLGLHDMPNSNVLLPDIIKFEHLFALSIEHGGIEAPDVATLSKMRIGSLALADNKTLGDDALAIIAKMRSVKFLDLRGTTAITDAGLQHLAKMKQLEQVQLGPSKITDAGVSALRKALPGCKVQH